MAMFVASLMIPASFAIGSLRITPYTGLLIIFIIPMFMTFLRDQSNRIVALDVFMAAHVLWSAVAILHAHGLDRLVFAVNTGISSFGGYMIGRVLIRNPADYERFFRYFFWGLLIFLPFAVIEMFTKRVFVTDLFGTFMNVSPRPNNEPRMGLNRVQAFTEHPITFGLFCSVGVSNLFYIYREHFAKRLNRAGTAVFMTLLSLSSAPTIAVVMQCILIGWDWLLGRVRYKWIMLVIILSVVLSVAQMAAPHGIVGLVIDNMSFNPMTGWTRATIFEYGFANALRNPFFGVGLGDWIRPWWLGPSVDNFWLLMAMRYGLPALFFLWMGLLIHAIQVMSAKGLSEQADACRKGYMFAWVGVFFVLGTVHIWGSTAIFIMTYIGAGAWLYTGQTNDRYRRSRDIEQEALAARVAQAQSQAKPNRGEAPVRAPHRRATRS